MEDLQKQSPGVNPWDAILRAKRQLRKQLAALPYEEKVEMVRHLRERSQQLASNPLRHQPPRNHKS